MTAICQKSLPDAPWAQAQTRRLPGVQPLDPATWIVVDDAYASQMAERTRLLAESRSDVLQIQPDALPAARELLRMVLAHLGARDGFEIGAANCTRPDGQTAVIDHGAPLETLCHLVTEDFCILQKRGTEHVLTAGLLCFPASWTLAEKFGHPLMRIHAPVDSYTDNMAKRVQRLFDAVRADRPLWRANAMLYHDPTLFQPRPEAAPRTERTGGDYLRSERQCILRLPVSDAVIFSIHTRQVALGDLTPDQAEALRRHPIDGAFESAGA
ncbi:MAG: DUF3445 domain-containing protein [Pseudomonadota bacterium]